MTCIIAYKGPEGVVLGCDSQTSFGGSKLFFNKPKWVAFDNFAIATCGDAANWTVLDSLRYDSQFKEQPAKTLLDIYVIVKNLRNYMKDNGYLYGGQDVASFGGDWILVTEKKIYSVCGYFGVYEVKGFHSTGSGGDIAYGAIKALECVDMTPEAKIRKALEVAASRDTGCGGQLIVKSVRELINDSGH